MNRFWVTVGVLLHPTLWPQVLRLWLIHMSDVYPPRWYWPVVRIYGGPEGQEARSVYMTRILLGPATPWGQLYLHIFHREDTDRDPHDHPFSFWTMPLNQGYFEEVYDHDEHGIGCFKTVRVPRLHVSFRPAEHSHRVVSTTTGRWPLVTLVWRGVNERKWGFWTRMNVGGARREFTPYREYVYQGANANIEGVDAACPGTAGRFTDASRPH